MEGHKIPELSPYLMGIFEKEIKRQPLQFVCLHKRWDSMNEVIKVPTSVIPNECTIKNIKKNADPDDDYITLRCIRTTSTKDGKVTPVDYKIDERLFNVGNKGELVFDSESRTYPYFKKLAAYMFFSAFNESNKDKPWHVPPVNGGYLFKLADRKKEVQLGNLNELEVAKSVATIAVLTDEQLQNIGEARYNFDKPDLEEVKSKLIAEVKSNPMILHEITDDKKSIMTANLKDAEKLGVIKFNDSTWFWSSGDLIILADPTKDRYSVLSDHLIYGMGGLAKHEMILEGIKAQKKDKAKV
jgi:hypothetical protein